MDNSLQPWTAPDRPPDTNPAEAAFAELSIRIAVVETLLRGLAAKREEMPDYSGTLEEMAALLEKMRKAINALAARPAMQITPDEMATQIAAAAAKARAEDHAAMKQAREQMEKSARLMDSHGARAETAREQRRHLAWTGSGGLFAGALLMSFLPGTIAREMPASWHWPERMAAHALGRDRWSAGERLLATDDPEHWRAVVLGNSIVQDNQDAIAACLRAAVKQHKPARCTVTIALPQPQAR